MKTLTNTKNKTENKYIELIKNSNFNNNQNYILWKKYIKKLNKIIEKPVKEWPSWFWFYNYYVRNIEKQEEYKKSILKKWELWIVKHKDIILETEIHNIKLSYSSIIILSIILYISLLIIFTIILLITPSNINNVSDILLILKNNISIMLIGLLFFYFIFIYPDYQSKNYKYYILDWNKENILVYKKEIPENQYEEKYVV